MIHEMAEKSIMAEPEMQDAGVDSSVIFDSKGIQVDTAPIEVNR